MWKTPTKAQIETHKRWVADGGREKLVGFDFLTPNSWVWEIGGYKGKWVKQIADKYDPYITVFEPVKEFASEMTNLFSANLKIRIENYGLSYKDRDLMIGLSDDGTGIYCPTVSRQAVKLKSVVKVMGERLTDSIDLMKCNCEGGEYDILLPLIHSKLVTKFNFIIIQFHNLHETHPRLRTRIQDELSKTHRMTMCYDWKFEYWELI